MRTAIHRRHYGRFAATAFLALLSCLSISRDAVAQAGTCVPSTGYNYPTPNSNLRYRINVDDASSFGLTGSELIGATMLAADIWNQQGNGRSFTYAGTTNFKVSDLVGKTKAQCAAMGVDFSIVEFDGTNVNPGYTAIDIPVCCPSNNCPTLAPASGSGTGTQIGVYVPSLASGFGNGFNGASWDLTAELVHEFGHSLGLAHPGSGEAAVMDIAIPFSPNHRDLWEYDFKCAKALGGDRTESAMSIEHEASGVLGSPTQIFSGTQQVAKAMVGLSYVSGTAYFAKTYHRGSAISFAAQGGTSYTNLSGISDEAGIGFQLGLWRESTGTDRVFYTHWLDTTQYNPNAEHFARTAYTTNKFGSTTYNALKACTSMTGWLACSDKSEIRTQGAPAVAWWNGGSTNDRTVMAWSNMRREDGGTGTTSNEIWISVGSVDNLTLPLPWRTGLVTSVPPAVACRNNFSSSWDCILAYVPATSTTNRITVRRRWR